MDSLTVGGARVNGWMQDAFALPLAIRRWRSTIRRSTSLGHCISAICGSPSEHSAPVVRCPLPTVASIEGDWLSEIEAESARSPEPEFCIDM